MIEYPSIINSSRAPREPCIAFDKLDGSNIRVKYTHKAGFTLFGSRHNLFDESFPLLAGSIPSFKERYEKPLTERFKKDKLFQKAKEIIAFGEWVGDKSYAGSHDPDDPTKRFVLIDVLIVLKDRHEFVKPQEFVNMFQGEVEIPRVIYEGTLNEEFIKDVRANKFNTFEGVICKGTITRGSARGKIWMCKIKTEAYLDSLKNRFGDDWEKYAE